MEYNDPPTTVLLITDVTSTSEIYVFNLDFFFVCSFTGGLSPLYTFPAVSELLMQLFLNS